MKTKIYAAYGSNMNIFQMQYRCPSAKLIGTTILDNYKLTFRGKKRGVANIERSKDNQVPIVLWEITEECEKSLDKYEGFPTLYVKIEIEVIVDGEVKKAMAYVMNTVYENFISIPHENYVRKILKGYEDNGIDKDTVYNALQETYYEISENTLKVI
ncbi:MAG: gamma-glutamylcyclotransferase family protein [Aminipila sp.]